MCQAKINDHYNNKYKCLREDVVNMNIVITYGSGHMKDKTKRFNKILCSKHAKLERYKANFKRKKGHAVIVTEKQLLKQ